MFSMDNKSISFFNSNSNTNQRDNVFISYEEYIQQKLNYNKKIMFYFILFNFFFAFIILFGFILKISYINDFNNCKLILISDFYVYLIICIFWVFVYIKNTIINVSGDNKVDLFLLKSKISVFSVYILENVISGMFIFVCKNSCSKGIRVFAYYMLVLKSVHFFIQLILQIVYINKIAKKLKEITSSEMEESLDNKQNISNFKTSVTLNNNNLNDTMRFKDNDFTIKDITMNNNKSIFMKTAISDQSYKSFFKNFINNNSVNINHIKSEHTK